VIPAVIVCGGGNQILSEAVDQWIKTNINVAKASPQGEGQCNIIIVYHDDNNIHTSLQCTTILERSQNSYMIVLHLNSLNPSQIHLNLANLSSIVTQIHLFVLPLRGVVQILRD
jgi:hypothetical protein